MDAAGTTTSAILRTDVLHPVEDDGGLIKEVHAEGSGELPQTGYEIKAHYTGRLLDGTVFDSSVSRGVPFTFTLGQGQVIRGWDDGTSSLSRCWLRKLRPPRFAPPCCHHAVMELALHSSSKCPPPIPHSPHPGFASMRKGEKALLRCGPGYAYGVGGSPPKIPGNATLEFTVELLSFSAPPRDFSSLPAREQLAAGEENKAAGNAAFTRGDLAAALEAYNEGWRAVETTTDEAPWGGDEPALSADEATALRSLKVTLKSNLAMVHLKSKVSAGWGGWGGVRVLRHPELQPLTLLPFPSPLFRRGLRPPKVPLPRWPWTLRTPSRFSAAALRARTWATCPRPRPTCSRPHALRPGTPLLPRSCSASRAWQQRRLRKKRRCSVAGSCSSEQAGVCTTSHAASCPGKAVADWAIEWQQLRVMVERLAP